MDPKTSTCKDSGKRKRSHSATQDGSLEDRVASLEKSTRVEVIKELKDKVRTLCLQPEPSDSLILLTLDELAKVARRADHEDTEMYEELARQANRHQAKLDISNLCLSVLGGKAADAITKAISRCMKDVKTDQKKEVSAPKPEDSPLHNLYGPFQAPGYQYQFPMYYPFARGGYRGRQRQVRPRGPCHFCGNESHLMRDCEKMKQAKENLK